MAPVGFLAALLGFAAQAVALDLVVDGRSDYTIVVATDAIPAEQFAAEELANHVEQMSGAKLPIVSDSESLPAHTILLGRPRYVEELNIKVDWGEFGKEGYLLLVKGEHLAIVGGRPRGTLYGVYALLEDHLGCRWFAPETSNIPSKKTIKLPKLNVTGRPSFEYRDPWMYSGHIWSYWWRTHFDADYVSRTRNSGRLVNLFTHKIDERHGGFFAIPRAGHNLSVLVPAKRYAADHPEYYALWKGKRMHQVERTTNYGDLELCLTHPDVVRITAETMRRWMRENPKADMFAIIQSDTGIYCECDRCIAMYSQYGASMGHGGYAGRNLWFVNQVAAQMEDEFPDNRIATWAYQATRNPPRNIKAHRNVVICFLPIERCWCHPLDRGLVNRGMYDYAGSIEKWQAIAREVQLWDYASAGELILQIGPNVRAAKRLNMTGVLVDAIWDIQSGFGFLRYWLWAQSMRNADWDDDWGLHEFLNAYYGAAAPYIDGYIRLLSNPRHYDPIAMDRAWLVGLDKDKYANEDSDARQRRLGCHIGYRTITMEAIEEGYRLFELARKVVADDSKSRGHVETARMELQYLMLEHLPGDDPRLKAEAIGLLQLAKKLEMKAIDHTPRGEYRDKVSEKLGVEIPD